jgi:DNA-binding transcriptional LysR family regulator
MESIFCIDIFNMNFKHQPGAEDIDIKLLRLLDALHATNSVTRTAERLALSQPTVSIGLARLRKMLADPLFVRTPDGMQPTPRMEDLMPSVRQVLTGISQLISNASHFDAATSERTFRIFMTDASHITLMPRLFAHVHALAPGIRLEAATIGSNMATDLQSGEADLALGLIPSLEAGFYQQALFDQDWICLCNPNHPRLGAKFTLKTYLAESHVGIVSGTGSSLLDKALQHIGQQRQTQLALPGFLGLSAILLSSDLIATLPRHIGETLGHAAGLRVYPCPLPIEGFTVKQYWHTRFHHDPANRWLRAVCGTLFLQTQRHLKKAK